MKSHFRFQKLIFHCLKKIFLKQVDVFYFRSHKRSELPAHKKFTIVRIFYSSSEKSTFEKKNVIFNVPERKKQRR